MQNAPPPSIAHHSRLHLAQAFAFSTCIWLGAFAYWPYFTHLGTLPFIGLLDELCLAIAGVAILLLPKREDSSPLTIATFFAFAALFLLSLFWYAQDCSRENVVFYGTISYAIVLLALSAAGRRLPSRVVNGLFWTTIWFSIIGSIGLVIDSKTHYFFEVDLPVFEDSHARRLSMLLDGTIRPTFLFVSTTNGAATLVMTAGLLCNLFAATRRSRIETIAFIFAIVFIISGTAVTMARASYLTLGFILMFLALFYGGARTCRLLLYSILPFSVVAIGLSESTEFQVDSPITQRIQQTFGKDASAESSNQLRLALWKSGFSHIRETFPLGAGLGISNPKCRAFIRVEHFESSVLGFIHETGIIGVLLASIILACLFLRYTTAFGYSGLLLMIANIGTPVLIMASAPMLSNFTILFIAGLNLAAEPQPKVTDEN